MLVTRGLSQQGQEEDRAIREFFDPLAREFINAMHEALAAEFPAQRGRKLPGAISLHSARCCTILSDQRIERLSDGANVPADPSVATQLSAFITAGIRGAMTSFANCATEQAAEA